MTAAAFGPAGDVIALATAGNHVALFEAATLRHTSWSLANTARPPQRLLQMPGSVCGISFSPDPQVTPSIPHSQHHMGFCDPRTACMRLFSGKIVWWISSQVS